MAHRRAAGLQRDGRRDQAGDRRGVRCAGRGAGTPLGGTSSAQARWSGANRVEETGQTQAAAGLTAGTRVQIWLDRSGVMTTAPVSSTTAAVQVVIVAAVGWVGLGILLAAIFWIVRRRLNKTRFADWESEWRQIGPQWTAH